MQHKLEHPLSVFIRYFVISNPESRWYACLQITGGIHMSQSSSPELELHSLELSLLRPEARDSSKAVLLLSDDFIEFGSSGHIFSKAQVIESLKTDPMAPRSVDDMRIKLLAADIALVTYRAYYNQQPAAAGSLRSSVWVRRDGRWQMVFHQGTPCPGSK